MGPRFWFLADSIRQKSFASECILSSCVATTSCNIIIGNLFNRMGTLGLTGQQATVEDQIYIVRVYLTKAGNLKVCTVWSI